MLYELHPIDSLSKSQPFKTSAEEASEGQGVASDHVGVIYSHTVLNRVSPDRGHCPFALVIVQLENGSLVTGVMTNVLAESVRIGQAVEKSLTEARQGGVFFRPRVMTQGSTRSNRIPINAGKAA